jgi:hypothetical protein
MNLVVPVLLLLGSAWAMARPHAVVVSPSLEDYVIFQERLDAHTTPQREVLRIHIVLLAAQGFTNEEIAQALRCDPLTVTKWRNRFARCGRAGLLDRPRSGRPRCFSALQEAQVVALLCQPVASTPATAEPLDPAAAAMPPPEEAPASLPPPCLLQATDGAERGEFPVPSAAAQTAPLAAEGPPSAAPELPTPAPDASTDRSGPSPRRGATKRQGQKAQAQQRRAKRNAQPPGTDGPAKPARAKKDNAKKDNADRPAGRGRKKAKAARAEHKRFSRTQPGQELQQGQPSADASSKGPATAAKVPVKQPVGCVRSLEQILEQMQEQLGLTCSRSTLSRLLAEHELKPWRYQYWIFPQAADFVKRAGPLLDLYAGYWEGAPLVKGEFVLSLDEKTSIQARYRLQQTLPGVPGRPARVEWGYGRGGALQYLAGWDVHRGKVFGRCEAAVGIESFDRLLAEVMSQEPYASAKRVFVIVDNGSSHRGQRCVERLEGRYPNLKVVHLPVHASWLNQIEIYFSIIQRALLTPNDFHDLKHLEKSILAFQEAYNLKGAPFAWRFTRAKLATLVEKLEAHKRLAS